MAMRSLRGGKTRVILSISANQTTTYNLRTAASSPSVPVDVIVTVQSGVVLSQGFDTGSGWSSGTTLKMVNLGVIAGTGGNGAHGGDWNDSSRAGGTAQDGGDAIILHYPITIDNTSGFIYGGGGGGGAGESGGFSISPASSALAMGGGGGGGGQAYAPWAGTAGVGGSAHPNSTTGIDGSAGSDGTSAGPGAGGAGATNGFGNSSGAGGSGGAFGAAGGNGANASSLTFVSGIGIGGAGGFAVRLNGFTVTFTGGNNGTQVKGSVA